MANNRLTHIFFRLFTSLFLCFFSHTLIAQLQHKIDSLKSVIAQTSNDTVKLNALVELNEINQDRKELTTNFKLQIELAYKLKNDAAACTGYSQLGYYEYEKNNLVAADSLFKEGMKLAKLSGNDFAYGRMCNTMMCIYDKKGDLKTAIQYLQTGEQLLIKVKRMKNLTRLYCNASNVYSNHNLTAKSTEYVRKAYLAATIANAEGDPEPLTTASWYLATNLKEKGIYDSAIYYFQQGLRIAEKLEMPYTQGDMLRGLSDVFAEEKLFTKAKEYLQRAIVSYTKVNVPDRILDCEESLAYLNFMNKDFSTVKKYVLSRQQLLTDDSLQNNLYVYKWLSNIALTENDVDAWKRNSKLYEKANAALTDEKIQKNLLELEAKYNLSKKESELLRNENENRKRLWIIIALSFGFISLAGMAFLQYRNSRNKSKIAHQKSVIEKQLALAEERSRIAEDMHDDVGAGLSRIRYISAAMKDNAELNKEQIDRIVSLSDESVEKMNEIIWALNQGNQLLEEILYFTRSQCSEMISNAGIDYSFILPDKIPAITMSWKDCRNIYLLVKEAVNNAIKHAEASKISVEIIIQQQLIITVKDDGKGFDAALQNANGNGLRNYKKRIDHLKGKYTLHTTPGNGTSLQFEIPIS